MVLLVFTQSSDQLSVGLVWLGLAAYGLQLYFDFSAYSDIDIGLGRIFGFHFPENFDLPYLSRSITEHWRRWHITLGAWFRDYLYIPLGVNRVPTVRRLAVLLSVWGLIGLWHGSAWNFLLWGLYYGILAMGEKFLLGKVLAGLSPVTLSLIALGLGGLSLLFLLGTGYSPFLYFQFQEVFP